MTKDEKWMKIALDEAVRAQNLGEVPVGAIVVKDHEIIARAHNQCIFNKDPTAHAEIIALREAGNNQNNYRLVDVTLYVTLEPCAMCFGAMIHARIDRLVIGAPDYKTGVCGSCVDLTEFKNFNHQFNITHGVLENKSSLLIKKFFKEKRNKEL